MKHVTFAEKSLLVGDEAADLLLEFARLIGQRGGSDLVTMRAIGPDGNDVDATFLINASTVMMAETASAWLTEPDNADAEVYMTARIDEITRLYSLPEQLAAVPRPADDARPADDPPPDEVDPDHGTGPDGAPVENPSG